MAEIYIHPDPQQLIKAAARLVLETAAAAIQGQGRCRLVLSGGSTPLPLYELLAGDKEADSLEWHQVDFYWGDERHVPPDHPESNFRLADQALLRPRRIPLPRVHRIQGELEPAQAAARYQSAILEEVPGSPPRFDLVLLGMGEDGHTASLFPGTRAVTHPDQHLLVTPNYVPRLKAWRISLTPGLINAAGAVIFLVSGKKKAAVLKQVLEGPHQPEILPAQLIQPRDGRLIWLIDQEAASLLER